MNPWVEEIRQGKHSSTLDTGEGPLLELVSQQESVSFSLAAHESMSLLLVTLIYL